MLNLPSLYAKNVLVKLPHGMYIRILLDSRYWILEVTGFRNAGSEEVLEIDWGWQIPRGVYVDLYTTCMHTYPNV